MKTFWVGLEGTANPHGHGEDYREYVVVEDDEDPAEKLEAAFLRQAQGLTNLQDGDRVAVRLCKPMDRDKLDEYWR